MRSRILPEPLIRTGLKVPILGPLRRRKPVLALLVLHPVLHQLALLTRITLTTSRALELQTDAAPWWREGALGRQRARAWWRAHQMVPGLERPSGRAPSLIRAHVPGSRQSATRPPSTRVNGVRSWGLGSSGGRGRGPGTSVAICRGPGAEDPYLPGSQRQVHHPPGPHPLGLPSCWVGTSGLASAGPRPVWARPPVSGAFFACCNTLIHPWR